MASPPRTETSSSAVPTRTVPSHVVVMATDNKETTPCCCCCDDGCEEENEERGNWSCNFESILASISYAIGPAYLWAMPYVISRNGGGALATYLVLQMFISFPIVYLEMALGQYTSQGPIRAWRGVPILQGIGVGMVVMSAIVCIYYNSLVAQILYYLFYVTGDLNRATSCANVWNTPGCANSTSRPFAAEEYRHNYVLQLSDGIGNLGAVRGPLAGFLILAWLLVAVALSFGAKSLGKVAYVTTLVPTVLIVVMFVRAVSLPGASNGIRRFFAAPRVGVNNMNQRLYPTMISNIVFRLSLGYGGYTTLASYNRFHNNVLRDAILVVFIDFLVMLFCVLTTFAFNGYLLYERNSVVIRPGFDFAFVSMVEVFSSLPSGAGWAGLFFFTLFLMALGSQIVLVETVVTSLTDLIPKGLMKNLPGRESGLLSKRMLLHGVMTVAVCFLFFLLGLPYVTQGGSHLLSLVDIYNSIIQPYIFILLECVALSLLYGASCSRCCPALNRWMSDLSHMLQHVCCFCCATIVNGMAAAACVYYIPILMLVSHYVFTYSTA
ncbi:sodium- and chloride-dependent glycine transporter 2-like [Branchiostoma floridae]|uniref:Sodium- and chloride-dependent glycine transporter 2-like n=1 Tax=Branchiostoma floridae TaxID=7739 RepID=A0A9J7L1G9_BRAFL|nr:sodium- and chloride-dependent glycine transporter 2-like [Branchiostoma floridae]XP_035673482.1 sodium- and chloride-dependent glycine transporter 2-like [Branchiostoma floridae]XP_035673483.1 sodium- and chloride-dependent glycine transporter 2-like [Branchiostoma floridae]XP_035673484.1 sodium- and chloride-dependent glycine transporter 2-like [Branchiostoma floridae]XP_035673485.1 sodium- and chloride-dependent glycine transporter 2-like [Branchiostoma floridae]